MGSVSQAKQLSQKLLANPNLDYVQRFNYLSVAGDVAIAERKYPHAIGYFEQAISVAQGCGAFREAADLQSTLSRIHLSLGNVSKAEELARNAITTVERLGVIPLLPAELDSLAQVLIAQNKYNEADSIYERAATLQDMLIGKADSLITKTAFITGADQLYSHHFAFVADHFSNPAGTRQFRPIPLEQIQVSLDPSELLLEYVVAEPNSYVLVLTSNTQQIIKLAGRRRIEKMVAEYTTSVKRRKDAKAQARDLYATLLRPIPQTESKSRYVVIPGGCLNLLPFDALVDDRIDMLCSPMLLPTLPPQLLSIY